MKINGIIEKEDGTVKLDVEMTEQEHQFLLLTALKFLLLSGAIQAKQEAEAFDVSAQMTLDFN